MSCAPTSSKAMRLWLAWGAPASVPATWLAAKRLGLIEAARVRGAGRLLELAGGLAPVGWCALAAVASIWLARDVCRESFPDRATGCGLLIMAFGIFCAHAGLAAAVFFLTAQVFR
jgi:hypothetical protein